ncbi:MAG: phospho-N-acetylmuramoyl-pentapeptide-transferase [Planctomycetota bacterium]|nr:MAG: phospho-N-acetylmuramoyl-pentapeptide-transferase [Planctomycetota bacterium]
MFYYLHELANDFPVLNVFRYVTFRAAMGAVTAFLFSVIAGKRIIAFLQTKNIKENSTKKDSEKLAEMHAGKSSTPTMGGIIILAGFVLSTLLWTKWDNHLVWIVLIGTLLMGLLGAYDDWLKLTVEKSNGMSGKIKMLLLILIGMGIFLTYVYFSQETGLVKIEDTNILYKGLPHNHTTVVQFPFEKSWVIPLGWLYLPIFIFALVGTSNAVNLTDGLDGLAAGCMVMVALTYLIISYLCGHVNFSEYLHIIYIANASELTILCAIIVGGCLGFLWYNSYPAQIFMGDTGSLALGGFIGMVALMTKHEFNLIIAGGIFVAEALSVIIQVGVYKRTKKRVFLCAPLHHHFQFKGMSETKIVARFWIIGIIFALLALATIKIR